MEICEKITLLTFKGHTARMFFRIGSRIHPTGDQLLCAWGLMETKHGHPDESARLLLSAGTYVFWSQPHPKTLMFGNGLCCGLTCMKYSQIESATSQSAAQVERFKKHRETQTTSRRTRENQSRTWCQKPRNKPPKHQHLLKRWLRNKARFYFEYSMLQHNARFCGVRIEEKEFLS